MPHQVERRTLDRLWNKKDWGNTMEEVEYRLCKNFDPNTKIKGYKLRDHGGC